MTMLSGKKKQSISDQIYDVLKPKELVEEADDEARFEEFTEHSDAVHQLSDIRKQTAKHLSELDSKYKGKVVSRKEFEQENGDFSDGSSDSSGQVENNYATDSDEDETDENVEEEDEVSDQSSDGFLNSSESEGDGDDFDLSQFAKPQDTSRGIHSTLDGSNSTSETKILRDSSLQEEIKKGVSVQNQLKIWEKLLEVRIKSQKMLITANSLPDFDAHLELSSIEDSPFAEKVEETCDGLHGLLDNLIGLQRTLTQR